MADHINEPEVLRWLDGASARLWNTPTSPIVQDTLRHVFAERDRLRAEVEQLRAAQRPAVGRVLDQLNAAQAEIERLRAENERLRTELDEERRHLLADEERRKLTGDALQAEADRDRYRDALRELVEVLDPVSFITSHGRQVYYRAVALLKEAGDGD